MGGSACDRCPGEGLGACLSINASFILTAVGAPGEGTSTFSPTGAVYIYQVSASGNSLNQLAVLTGIPTSGSKYQLNLSKINL